MDFQIDFIFRTGAGYDNLVALIQGNPRYVFEISKQDSIDKRTKKAKQKGWVEIRHKRHRGLVKLSKSFGVSRASVSDQSDGMKLIGAWIGWLASNASDLIAGVDVRFV
jgi:hypothetical protein